MRLKSAVPHAKLPETLSHYDALLLPYADDEYNRGVIPAKLYECLATGLAVLASPLPALRHMGDCLYLVKTPAEWVEAANGLPETETPERRAGRVRKAREHAQAKAFSELKGAMEASLAQARHEPGSASPTPNQHLMAFLRGFTWIGFLYGLAKASTLLTQVAAGRWLGPIEYGKANLVLAAAAYLQILPMMGFPLAMSKFVSEEKKPAERSKIISTTFTTFLLWGSLWLLAAAAGRESIAGILSLPIPLFNLSLAFAYFTAFYIVVSSPLLGLKRFDYRGAAEAIYGLSAPAFLIFYALKGPPNHEALIITLCSSLAVAALYSLWTLRTYLKPAFEPSAFRLIFRYALVATLNLLAIACVLGPARLILHHHHHSAQEVGIFSAYFTSTAQVSLAFLYMLSSVLVPLASSAEGQRATWRTFRKFFLPMALGAMGFFLAAEAAALSLFGRQYPFRLDWAALFAAAAALILIHGVAAALYSARDFRGLCISVAGSLVAGLSNAALGLLLIPRWGITGAVLALVGAYGLGLAAYALASSLQKK
ncbi:MAG: oligosaccharide flippase family protein [Elusimicrobia bacterium]|nr:oligosaccharide flippase family protein [Elusimicrobiota bacterium]